MSTQDKITAHFGSHLPDRNSLSVNTKRSPEERDSAISPSQSSPSSKTQKGLGDEPMDVDDTQSAGSPNLETKGTDITEAPPASSPTHPTSSPASLPSALRTSKNYAARARSAKDLLPPPILPHWMAHRFAVTFDIKKPKDKHKRTEYIAKELNECLEAIRTFTKVKVRKFKEHHIPRNGETASWII